MTYEIWNNIATAWEKFEEAPSDRTALALMVAINAAR
jgi:hypothetical protein